ncbi:MAG: chorismate mutase [Lachnospiraceae bacterium]|nr:chorismate mutase [Lachnospiraceae bacterium]
MRLEEVRKAIDALDPEIRELLMERLDLSFEAAEAKRDAGDIRIYRPDREEKILKRLGRGVEEERKAPYLAVVRKIMETSRMYQYGLLYDWAGGFFADMTDGLVLPEKCRFVRIRMTRPDRPGSMASVLGMVGDYGFNMKSMTLLEEDPEKGKVTFELVIRGDLYEEPMQRLMFQLSMECENFKITEVF